MADGRYYAYRRTRMAAFLPETYGTVLEIGCGEGAFAGELKDGTEVWGIEPNAGAARKAGKHMKRVLTGTFMQMQSLLPAGYFDLVVCNDVMEHMEDEKAFLTRLREKMKDGGYLVASVPNVRHYRTLYELLVLKDWRYEEAGVLDRTHLRYFTKKSLLRTLSESGFVVEKLRGINAPERWVLKLLLSAILISSFGYYADIRFQQYALRAKQQSG